MPVHYTMFGAPLSLYSGKLRSYFRKKGLPWQEKLPTHPENATKVLPAVGRIVIPTVLTSDGEIMQDTAEIIDALEARHPENSMVPAGALGVFARIFQVFGDEALLRPAMHYRWNFDHTNQPFITYEFVRSLNHKASFEEAQSLSGATMAKMQSYLPALGINETTIPVLEAAYEDLLDRLNAHFRDHPYFLGSKPSLPDFGFMGPLYAHLARDPYPATLMKNRAPHVWRWVERMNSFDLDAPEIGDAEPAWFKGVDDIPDTLIGVLQWFASDYLPELKGAIDMTNAYLDNNPDIAEGTPVIAEAEQRTLGFFNFTARKTEFTVAARHYTLWDLGQGLAQYDALPAGEQAALRALMEKGGLGDMLDHRVKRPLVRINFKECWGTA